MAIKKDSLLLRIIFYNGVAIVFISAILATIFGIMIFNEINMRLLDKSREKVSFLNKAYINAIERTRDDLYNSTANGMNLIIRDAHKVGVQDSLANVIASQLKISSYLKYENVYLQIISPKGAVLGESGNKKIKYDIIDKGSLVPSSKILAEEKKYFFISTDNNMYIRIIQPYRWGKLYKKNYVLMTMPISNYSLQEIKDYAQLDNDNKVFVLSGGKYIYGELDRLLENKDKISFADIKNKRTRRIVKYNSYFFEKKIKEEVFYMGVIPLRNEKGSYEGYIGVAISKNNFLAIKYMLATAILAICLLAVVISTALCAKIFTKLLNPLSDLADITQKIGFKDFNSMETVEVDEENVYEIRTIASSLKAMLNRINLNEEELKSNNIKLKENLIRITSIEKILMEIDLDKSLDDSISRLLKSLTSEVGFNYSRAIYFAYDEVKNNLYAKKASIDERISLNLEEYTHGMKGFKFQIKDLNEMLPLLKLKLEEGNLFWDTLKTKKIIYRNDKGYKYNFGNDIFKSLGLNNFLILPIVEGDKKIACILVDYFGKDKDILEEEVELMTLLLMNLNIRVKNNLSEEEKIANERIATAIKISNKFLNINEDLLNNTETFVEKILNNRYNDKDINKIISYIRRERKENIILREIVNTSKGKFKPIKLEKLIEKIIKDSNSIIKKYGIDVSVFFTNSGYIYGNRKKIYQMFVEIFKNSLEAIITRNKLDKKINILITKDENEKIVIEITDNGVGMTEEELESLKKPYAEAGESIIGLGLTIVYKIVREHEALINIKSQLAEGTRVRIIFKEYKGETK